MLYIDNYMEAGIVGIEEIETSIHPKMMRQLLEIITEALGNAPLIISKSESPDNNSNKYSPTESPISLAFDIITFILFF